MVHVADANVFIHGRGQYPFEEAFTVPGVMEELKSQAAKTSFDTEDIEIREPGEETLEAVKQKSREISSPTSDTDEQLLALAMEMDATLLTDDKALQNLALHLGVKFESFLADRIDGRREWRRVCENCGAESGGGECDRCGSSSFLLKPG